MAKYADEMFCKVISIPTGAIKSKMWTKGGFSRNKISIPTGAIKRKGLDNSNLSGRKISIPTGAIKRQYNGAAKMRFLSEFQFLLVRLKGSPNLSIPSCSEFQFLLVRLKVGFWSCRIGCSRLFQFLLVRLKVIMYRKSRAFYLISIPTGAIKRHL